MNKIKTYRKIGEVFAYPSEAFCRKMNGTYKVVKYEGKSEERCRHCAFWNRVNKNRNLCKLTFMERMTRTGACSPPYRPNRVIFKRIGEYEDRFRLKSLTDFKKLFHEIKATCEDKYERGKGNTYCYNMPIGTDRRYKDSDYAYNMGYIRWDKCMAKNCPKLRDEIKDYEKDR